MMGVVSWNHVVSMIKVGIKVILTCSLWNDNSSELVLQHHQSACAAKVLDRLVLNLERCFVLLGTRQTDHLQNIQWKCLHNPMRVQRENNMSDL